MSSYSSFGKQVDLTLSGSQLPISPPKSSRPSSARSSSSSILSSSSQRRPRLDKSKSFSTQTYTKPSVKTARRNGGRERDLNSNKQPSLAMSFPAKENKKPIQTNLPNRNKPSSVCSDDHISMFFDHASQKSRSNSRSVSSRHSRPQSNVSLGAEDRVFTIPDSARSGSTVSCSSNRDEENGSGDFSSNPHDASDVDFLRSYLSNVEKYRDDPPAPPVSSESTPRNLPHPLSVDEDHVPTKESESRGDSPGLKAPPLSSRVSLDSFEKHELEQLYDDNNGGMSDEVLQFQRERSARKIQHFYRRHSIRRKTSDAAVKRMLEQKKEEYENNILR
uniref:Uncharacterized protein n=1 Tax=Ciona savignyi TaxID=51511 RepID=H2ZAS1_CIOSA